MNIQANDIKKHLTGLIDKVDTRILVIVIVVGLIGTAYMSFLVNSDMARNTGENFVAISVTMVMQLLTYMFASLVFDEKVPTFLRTMYAVIVIPCLLISISQTASLFVNQANEIENRKNGNELLYTEGVNGFLTLQIDAEYDELAGSKVKYYVTIAVVYELVLALAYVEWRRRKSLQSLIQAEFQDKQSKEKSKVIEMKKQSIKPEQANIKRKIKLKKVSVTDLKKRFPKAT